MLVHVMAQPELKEGDGPIALICAPTRELCQQIHSEVKKFGKCYNLRVSIIGYYLHYVAVIIYVLLNISFFLLTFKQASETAFICNHDKHPKVNEQNHQC